MYALFENDKQISKAHSKKEAVVIEAFERKLFFEISPDFFYGTHEVVGVHGVYLVKGYKIKRINHV